MSLQPTYNNLKTQLITQLGLQETDFTQTYDCKTWSSGAASGTTDWMQESNPKYLTGATFCTKQSDKGEEYTINVWMGPSFDTPNIVLTFGNTANNEYYIVADTIPRGATPLGSDPQYMEQYFSSQSIASWTKHYTTPNLFALPPPSPFNLRLLASPNRIALINLQESDATQILNEKVNTFCGWLDGATPIAARSRGSFNMRDDKLRQFYYQGITELMVGEFGEEMGRSLGASYTGPVAEAYVGGGS